MSSKLEKAVRSHTGLQGAFSQDEVLTDRERIIFIIFMERSCYLILVASALVTTSALFANTEPLNEPKMAERFVEMDAAGNWEERFFDDGVGTREEGNWNNGKWQEKWFLDGEIASVRNTQKGLLLTAGPRWRDDAHHMVLWTHQQFEGDLKIEYSFTRADFEEGCVVILYIQATGSGEDGFAEDISKWNDYRAVPTMSTYFKNMHTYHISYATNGPHVYEGGDYVRARRYDPAIGGLRGSEMVPDYTDTGLWEPGVEHQVTVIKNNLELMMKVEAPNQTKYFHFINDKHPPITHGRIGLRQMFTRSSFYKNFKVSESIHEID